MTKRPESSDKAWAGKFGDASADVPGTALLGKAFRLLDLIGSQPSHVSVAALASATGWPKATLYRILSALVGHGFVRLDPGFQGYTLGYRLLEYAQNVWAGPDLVAVASVELQRLRDITGETAYLAVPHADGVLSIGKFESLHDVRSAAKLGALKPVHCTSQGKAILAFRGEHEIDAALTGKALERFTEHTITDPHVLLAQLQIVRTRGYAVEDQEILIGNRCVGAPVLDSAGHPVAAISVAGPIYRLTNERVEQLGPEIVAVARNIGLRLNSSPRQLAASASSTVRVLPHQPAFYGAYPVWDATRSCLIWVDRLGPSLHMTCGDRTTTYLPPQGEPIDAIAFAEGERVLVTMRGRELIFDRDRFTEERSRVPRELAASSSSPAGPRWVAVKQGDETAIGTAGASGECQAKWSLRADISALAYCPDSETVFAADAATGTIYVLKGNSRQARILTRVPRVSGEPRALVVDGRGRLWVALYDGWSLGRLTDEGEIDRLIALPVPRPTGLAFGDRDLSTLYVTTARMGLPRDMIEHAPLSGSLLAVRIE